VSGTRAVTIRAAAPDDAPSIARVRIASWRWAYRGLVPDAVLDAMSVDDSELNWRRTILARDAISVFVAEDGAEAVGFVSAGPSRDDDASDGAGEIGAIYVLPAHAGTGVGGGLMAAAEDALRASAFTRATLWVLRANTAARGFYEHRGWTWDGTTSTHQVQCEHLPVLRYGAGL
jgi:GNAT superfamily N-acetyltransferase